MTSIRLAALLLCVALPASAFEFRGGEFGVNYIQYDFGTERSGYEVHGAADFNISGAFGAQVSASFDAVPTSPGSSVDFNKTVFGLHAYYDMSEAWRVGAYYQGNSVGVTGSSSYESTNYGLEAMFTPNERLAVQANLGGADYSENFGSSYDVKSIGLQVDYKVSDQLKVGAKLAADAYSTTPVTYFDSVSSLTASYRFDAGSLPIILSAEIGNYDYIAFGSTEGQFAKVGVSIPLGAAKTGGKPMFGNRGTIGHFPFY